MPEPSAQSALLEHQCILRVLRLRFLPQVGALGGRLPVSRGGQSHTGPAVRRCEIWDCCKQGDPQQQLGLFGTAKLQLRLLQHKSAAESQTAASRQSQEHDTEQIRLIRLLGQVGQIDDPELFALLPFFEILGHLGAQSLVE